MSRVNGEMVVDSGIILWELLVRPCQEHASEVWWTEPMAAC